MNRRCNSTYSNVFWMLLFFLCLLSSELVAEYLPSVTIFHDKQVLGEACAKCIVDLIREKQENGEVVRLGFATGSTPIPTYQALIRFIQKEKLNLSNVITFNLDEYVGLPPDHPESYHYFMFTQLFDSLIPNGLEPANIHIPNGWAKQEINLTDIELLVLQNHFPAHVPGTSLNRDEESWILQYRAKAYEALIVLMGPIDLQLLGIGTNGHIGFAEPGAPFDGVTAVVNLTLNTRLDNSRFFGNDITAVPSKAITMGIGTILRSNKIILMATGSSKASIISDVITKNIDLKIPATALKNHSEVMFFLDEEAAVKLQESTK